MLKVVIDTNVFISAILFGGKPKAILDLWQKQKIIFCTSPELNAEILNKLELKFNLKPEKLRVISLGLLLHTQKHLPKTKVNLCLDPADNFLLELAAESQADYIISGDKNVQNLNSFNNTKIISPADFLRLKIV